MSSSFLTDSNDDEDECLLATAEEMTNLITKVGGPEHVHCLLDPLENLNTVEETVVREKAIEACVVGRHDPGIQALHPHGSAPRRRRLVHRSRLRVRHDLRRVRSAPLRISKARSRKRRLCADETPMVRRAAAQHPEPAAACDPEFVRTEMLAIFAQLTTDEQDSVRLIVRLAPLGRRCPQRACRTSCRW